MLYFAGHGINTGNDVTLVTTDGVEHAWGVGFSEIMGQVTSSRVPEIHIISDCCFSGAAAGVPQLGTAYAVLRDGVSILTASRGDQEAIETGDRGLFSQAFCGALGGGAADVLGKVTVAGLYAYLCESCGFINGGMFARVPDVNSPVITIDVDDIDAALADIEAHGGAKVRPKEPVGEMGFAAYFTDSEGNLLGLWQSATLA